MSKDWSVPEAFEGIDEKDILDLVRDHPLSKEWQREIASERKQREAFEAQVSDFQKKEALAQKAQAFTEAGLEPVWADLYSGEDMTVEALKGWAEQKKLVPAAPKEEEKPQGAPFQPNVGGTPTTQAPLSRSDMDELWRTDPVTAYKRAQEQKR